MSNISAATERMTQNTPSSTIRVAIVDDNKSTVQSLSEVLTYNSKTTVSFIARSGTEFLEKIKSVSADQFPDVVIMDVNMPGMNGIEAVRQGKILYPEVKFLMLTVFDDEDTLFEAIRAGASGYLLKDERSSVILSHIENLMEDGSSPMSPRIARKTLDLLAASAKPIPGKQIVELKDLTTREKDVLYLLVDGLEYRAISERLHISPHTVRKHISNIYEKLHISSKAQAIRLMQGTLPAPAATLTGRHKILLVDDHQIILDSLSMMMGTFNDMEVAGKISDPREVMYFLQQHPTDLMITDINMPHLDGLQLANMVRSKYPDIKILMLTVSESAEQVKDAVRIGVEGYVLKKANKDELSTAVHTIMSGHRYYSQSLQGLI
jgi:DNA-binding NarL/FixJ family response regulator